jgi:hypothetical protein
LCRIPAEFMVQRAEIGAVCVLQNQAALKRHV